MYSSRQDRTYPSTNWKIAILSSKLIPIFGARSNQQGVEVGRKKFWNELTAYVQATSKVPWIPSIPPAGRACDPIRSKALLAAGGYKKASTHPVMLTACVGMCVCDN